MLISWKEEDCDIYRKLSSIGLLVNIFNNFRIDVLTFHFSNDQRTQNINLPLSSPLSRFWSRKTTLKEARYRLHEEGIHWVHYLMARPLSKFVYTVKSLNEDWEPSHNDSISAGTTLHAPVACTSCMHTAMNHAYLQNWTHDR